MRRKVTLILALLVIGFTSCDGSQESIKDFPKDTLTVVDESNEFIAPDELNNRLMTALDGAVTLVDEVFNSDSSKIEQSRDNLQFEIKIQKSEIKSLQLKNGGGDDFKNAVLSMLEMYETEFGPSFDEIITIIKKPESLSEEEEEELDEFDIALSEKETKLYEQILSEQEKFADAFKIKLVDREF